jgi:SDR family mycofactocin-dependent oxidoreductase
VGSRLQGKVALITGAARGQGRAHAIRLASEGADIIAVDICEPIRNVVYRSATKHDLAETVEAVKNLDRRIVSSVADIRDRASLKAAVAEGIATLGSLDVVVANAAITIAGAWDTITPEVFQDTVDINLTGTWNTIQATAPHMLERGGSIILVSSAAGLRALPFLTPYVASKWGVTGLMKAFALELGAYGIRVNSLHPGPVNTQMGRAGTEMRASIEKAMTTNPKLGVLFSTVLATSEVTEPEDQADAVTFLASDESRYVTGVAISVDLGNALF